MRTFERHINIEDWLKVSETTILSREDHETAFMDEQTWIKGGEYGISFNVRIMPLVTLFISETGFKLIYPAAILERWKNRVKEVVLP